LLFQTSFEIGSSRLKRERERERGERERERERAVKEEATPLINCGLKSSLHPAV